MTLEDAYLLAGIIAALGVIVSLVFVGFQINQNTAATRMAAAQAVHANFADWYAHMLGDPELATISVKGLQDYGALNTEEKAQIVSLFMIFSLNMQDAFYKWQEGSLAPELWRSWEEVSLNLFSTEGGNAFWAERGYLFGQGFKTHISEVIMKRTPDPLAKPFGAFEIGS